MHRLAVDHAVSYFTVEHIVDSVMLRFADRMEAEELTSIRNTTGSARTQGCTEDIHHGN
jgi:hypothetical protein